MILNNFYQYLKKAGYIPEEDYVLFSGPSSFTITKNSLTYDGELYYSTNGIKYLKWDGSTITSGLDSSDNLYKIYFQGAGNTYCKSSFAYSAALTMTGSNVSISGYIAALLDAKTVGYGIGSIPAYASNTFYFLFMSCRALKYANNLKLMPILNSSTTNAYQDLFRGCTNLEKGPSILPSTGAAGEFYYSFYESCSKITEVPFIYPQELSGDGYNFMFKGCSLIKEPAPIAIKALGWASPSFNDLYQNCSNLERMPRIRDVGLRMSFDNAFNGCSKIKVSETQDATYQYAFTMPANGSFTNMFANTGGTFTGTPTAGTTYYTDQPLVEPYYPLKFSSANSFTIAQNSGTTSWDGTIQYSTDGNTWTTWDGTTVTAASDGTNYNLYFRGSGNTYVGNDSNTAYWVITGSGVSVSGEMSALIDYSATIARTGITITDYTYAGLFLNQTALVDASKLYIEKVESNSCRSMFSGCTNLVSAPYVLPSNLEGGCYYSMFYGCTSLVDVPTLPATSMKNDGYRQMFYGCTSLTKAPALPATTIDGSNFYGQMFYGCTSLVKAPRLPATSFGFSWNDTQYKEMFYGCTSLTKAPDLPATTLNERCYEGMFEGCTALTEAPALISTSLAQNCYANMFKGCTSLVTAPALPATSLAIGCYASMFEGCTNLEVIPDLTAVVPDSSISWQYAGMYSGCSKVKVYTDPSKGTEFMTGFGEWNMGTFSGTSGDYTGDADSGTYYTSNQLV